MWQLKIEETLIYTNVSTYTFGKYGCYLNVRSTNLFIKQKFKQNIFGMCISLIVCGQRGSCCPFKTNTTVI